MQKPVYDSESDSIYFKLRSGSAYETIEVSSHILVDISKRNNMVMGIEVVDASHFLSSLTAKKIDKKTIKHKLSIHLPEEGKEEIKLAFAISNREYVYAIPKSYTSPIVAANF